jgi:putative membrane protein
VTPDEPAAPDGYRAAAPAQRAADDTTAGTNGWERLHPLTPLLRGGRFVAVLVVIATQQGLRQASPEGVLAVLGVGLVLSFGLGYVAWRAMRYRVTATELQVESGVLTRRSRRVPLARVQAVDVVRPLYARPLGLAELRLEVVGGGDAEAPLAFLTEADAQQVRSRLLDLAAGRAAAEAGAAQDPAPASPDRVLVAVPTGPLIWSTVLGAPVWTAGVLLLALAGTALVDSRALGAVVFASFPVALGVGSMALRRVLSEYGFSVAESVDGLRLRHGLLEKRTQTIPPGRVQVIRVSEPLLWRTQGWVRVEVDVAGYSGGAEEQAATGALLPVAPRELAAALVARVLSAQLPAADRPAPPAARLRAPLSFPKLRLGLDDSHLVSSYGIVTTTTDVVPLRKVQSLRLTQGPWERRLGLASLHADTAGRRLPGAVARHRGAAEARELLADLTARARAARTSR